MTLVVLGLQKFRKTSTFELLFLIGTLSTAYSRLVEIPQMFTWIPNYVFLTSFVSQAIFTTLSDFFTTIPIFGRLNTLIPDGFESTGANILNSLITLAGSISLVGTKTELQYFGVVNGYYGRLKTPLMINLAASVFVGFICPLFLIKRSTAAKKVIKKAKK